MASTYKIKNKILFPINLYNYIIINQIHLDKIYNTINDRTTIVYSTTTKVWFIPHPVTPTATTVAVFDYNLFLIESLKIQCFLNDFAFSFFTSFIDWSPFALIGNLFPTVDFVVIWFLQSLNQIIIPFKSNSNYHELVPFVYITFF